MIGTCFLNLFEPDERETMAFRMATTAVLNQVRHVGADDRLLYVDIRISPSEYTGQQVLLVTISDVTKRLEAEQQLIQASKMATLGEMATGVAHELNQPLSVIKTASNFFMRKLKKKEPIRDEILLTMSEEIDSHVERATKIINHMRQFGRKSDPNLEPVLLNEVLERAFEIFSQQLKVRGIEVKWQTDPDLPRVMGNPSRLEQVIINLLINARDAIEERSDHAPESMIPRMITLVTTSNTKTVSLSVCDTGSGVPEPIRGKIFEPFYTTKKVGKGTGLGLSISYSIVKECGGTIDVTDEPGRRRVFQPAFSHCERSFMTGDILLVDDEAGIRKVLGISLADLGYTVHAAEDAAAALKIIDAVRPSITLTDIKMPGMDGIELLKAIKGRYPDTEVIMLTGHGDMDLAIESLKFQATDFITKPISDDALIVALKRAGERIEMRRQLKAYTENLERPGGRKIPSTHRGGTPGRGRGDGGRTLPHHQEYRRRPGRRNVRSGKRHRAGRHRLFEARMGTGAGKCGPH